MRSYVPFVVAALVVAAAPARAEDREDAGRRSHRLPFNPLAKATFEAFGTSVNMDSPKKAAPMEMP